MVRQISRPKNVRLSEDEDEAMRIWAEMIATERPDAPLVTFAVLAELYLRHAETALSPDSYRDYTKFIVDFCRHHSSTRAVDLKPHHVTKWLAELGRRNKTVRDRRRQTMP